MELSSFAVGKKYEAKRQDFMPPDGSPTVPGETIRFTVLQPANAFNRKTIGDDQPTATELASWAEFLRVENHGSERINLLHPDTIASAIELD
jgi:hypothetical protein